MLSGLLLVVQAGILGGKFFNFYTNIDDGGIAPEAVIGGQIQVGNVVSQSQCATSDVSAADKGAAITVNIIAYTVVAVHPEGTDVTTLIPERV